MASSQRSLFRKTVTVLAVLWVGLISSGLPNVAKLRTALTMMMSEETSPQNSTRASALWDKNSSNSSNTPQLRVLVAQYSAGVGEYNLLLNLTQPINQQYASKWGYDYHCMKGPPEALVQAMERANVTSFAPSRSTYFKVILLRRVSNEYDRVILLDADALVYDFSCDIVQLLPSTKLLAAHKVVKTDPVGTGNLNVGVTVWNLRHDRAPWLIDKWKTACWDRLNQGYRDDDQLPLQRILQFDLNQTTRDAWIEGLTTEFAYGHGTVVKHFIRSDKRDWSTGSSLELRMEKIQRARAEICAKYRLQC